MAEPDPALSAELLWPAVADEGLPALGCSGTPVQVFSVALEVSPARLKKLSSVLWPQERERADRFHFERDRRRFIACRGILRRILGSYLGISARDVEFAYRGHGKPTLGGTFAECGLDFNVSHSGDLALIAVGRGAAVGVDVEQVRALSDAGDLVARFFSQHENEAFQRLAPESRPQAFFNLWTRKEAWLKATGEGIAHRLSQVEVTFLPGESVRLLGIPEGLDELDRWTLLELAPAPGYAAALAIREPVADALCWSWSCES